MIDYSIELPDLCWFNICQYLSIEDIAQLSSTCRTLRQMFWSRQPLLWIYLINLRFHSSVLCQSIRALFEQDEDENEDAIIAENHRFSQRLLCDVEAYNVLYEKFLKPGACRTWHVRFTLAEKEKRGFFAWRRFNFSKSIPLLDCPIPLSSELFRWYYYRLNKKTILAPIGAMIYAYLIDSRRCLSVSNMVYRNNTMAKGEQRSMKIANNGGVCLTRPDESSISSLMTHHFFDQIPLWTDLLPGRYNLTCQMLLQRHFVDNCPNDDYLLGKAPVEFCLLGDRADRGGRRNILRYPWLISEHRKYGDNRWFHVSLIENFLLHDISNVYCGIRVMNDDPILFDVWIKTIQLNFISIN